jgi:hypothetical protein
LWIVLVDGAVVGQQATHTGLTPKGAWDGHLHRQSTAKRAFLGYDRPPAGRSLSPFGIVALRVIGFGRSPQDVGRVAGQRAGRAADVTVCSQAEHP